MRKKVYFAGSIRGGREDAHLYKKAIDYLNTFSTVLTEQVGDLSRSIYEQSQDADALIYTQDTNWLKECDLVIAECTHPSLGVGYELAYAEKLKKPVYIFYRKEETQLSAMVKGNSYFHIYTYSSEEDLFSKLKTVLKESEN